MKLDGIIPAIVTPFDRDGDVNYTELKKLTQLLLEEGADGFYVTGSTGECFLLTDEERTRVVAAVAETVNGKVPVIAHIGNRSLPGGEPGKGSTEGRSLRRFQCSTFLLQFPDR